MNEKKSKASEGRAPKGRGIRRSGAYPFEFRLKVVTLILKRGTRFSYSANSLGYNELTEVLKKTASEKLDKLSILILEGITL